MAITAAFLAASQTPNGITLQGDSDGQGGTTFTVTPALIQAAITLPGPLRDLFVRTYASAPDVRDRILTGATRTAIQHDAVSCGADFIFMPVTGLAGAMDWTLDLSIDGPTLQPRITLFGPANVACTVFWRINYRYSGSR